MIIKPWQHPGPPYETPRAGVPPLHAAQDALPPLHGRPPTADAWQASRWENCIFGRIPAFDVNSHLFSAGLPAAPHMNKHGLQGKHILVSPLISQIAKKDFTFFAISNASSTSIHQSNVFAETSKRNLIGKWHLWLSGNHCQL